MIQATMANLKLRTKLNISFAIVLFVPMVLATVFSIIFFTNRLQKEAIRLIQSDLKMADIMYHHSHSQMKNLAVAYAEKRLLTVLLDIDFGERLSRALAKSAKIDHIDIFYVIDATGKILVSYPNLNLINDQIIFQPHFEQVFAGSALGGIELDRYQEINHSEHPPDKQIMLTGAAPIYNRQRTRIKAVIVVKRIIKENNPILNTISQTLDANTALVYQGQVVAKSLQKHHPNPLKLPDPKVLNQVLIQKIPVQTARFKTNGHISTFMPLLDLEHNPVAVMMIQKEVTTYLQTRNIATAILLAIFLISFLLTFGIKKIIERHILVPVKHLKNSTIKISNGDYSHLLEVTSNDEIGQLSESFNKMAANLSDSRKALEQKVIELEQAEKQIQKAEKKYRQIFENALEGIFQSSIDNRFISANQALAQIFGYESPQDLMSSVHDIASQCYANIQDKIDIDRIAKEENRISGVEVLFKRKDGQPFWGMQSTRHVYNETKNRYYFEGSIVDITERKEKETALREREAATEASKAKSLFLANMSHEIRTPMNAILGMADILWESDLKDKEKKYVEILRNAGESLLNLINDILDLSKVEAGQLELENIGFNLQSIVEKTCEIMALKAHQNQLELICYIDPETPIDLLGDPNRIKQILTNLIGNAVKFTEKGEICIEITPIDQQIQTTEDEIKLLFKIRDTGIGIPKQACDHIFDDFKQVDDTVTRKYGGTGLGLSICKRLIQMMDGQIWVQSTQGQGSTFFFTCRFKLNKAVNLPITPPPNEFENLSTLVVDDNQTNRMILMHVLSSWKIKADQAEDGLSALKMIERASQSGTPYQLLLIDARMPEMDGFSLVEKIRGKYGSFAQMAILLTSDDTLENLNKAQNAGIPIRLIKPVKKDDLLAAIYTTIGKPLRAESQPGFLPVSTENKTVSPLQILLVEDNQHNQIIFKINLRQTPHHIEIAENGQIGFDKFILGSYDLVFMDKEMPVMDGYTAIQRIRHWETENGKTPVPIICLTAHAMKGTEQESLLAGSNAYMTKPFKKDQLLEIIDTFAPDQ